ncbi:MAG: peptidoglycan-associated lipoprotein [Deltaproteobacteria bacterium CG11_big_fil_rev_8_21_14_0_20_47_16]|nr:MAG: peptidoglycan-associated lipoprotein [Deltaproteobacteria bacterium CG11_big_fil_rev_8_21_14_0_20_47_16]
MKTSMGRIVAVAAVAIVAVAISACAQQQTTSPKKISSVYFDFDKYDVRADQQGTMKTNASVLQSNANQKIVIEGNCDERGSSEYNIALGDRRAKSAKSYLVNLGISGDRISTISYGKEKPVCTQHNESCWQQNRRDDFKNK